MANLYTKTGDGGSTSLVGGTRVSKTDVRVNAYGTVDEANSVLGLVYAQTDNAYIKASVRTIQKTLFTLGAQLAYDKSSKKKLSVTIARDDVSFLEGIVDHCTEICGMQTEFTIPGSTVVSATLHQARTIVRRAERLVHDIDPDNLDADIYAYVNRLSDALFALSRLEDVMAERAEVKEKVRELVADQLEKYQTPKPLDLSLDVATKMAEYAREKATELGVPVIFSVVDNGGNLLLLHRMEEAILGSINISMNKAYTAAMFKMSTDKLADLTQPGQPLYGVQNTNDNRVVIFGGGYPYMVDGKMQGAIGVSGGSVEEDMAIAEAALSKMGIGV